MKRTNIFKAASSRFLRPRLFDGYSPFELVEAVKERYHFNEVPTARQLSTHPRPTRPASFIYGKMEAEDRLIRVEQFLVRSLVPHATLLTASTRTSTKEADMFLNDLLTWAKEKYDLDTSPAFPAAYESQLAVTFDPSFGGSEVFTMLGQGITGLVRGYGFKDCHAFELVEVSMRCEGAQLEQYRACPFSLKRQVAPLSNEYQYFSQAPLRTTDHERLLAELERVVLGLQVPRIELMEE